MDAHDAYYAAIDHCIKVAIVLAGADSAAARLPRPGDAAVSVAAHLRRHRLRVVVRDGREARSGLTPSGRAAPSRMLCNVSSCDG
jgi:hypothetical protein